MNSSTSGPGPPCRYALRYPQATAHRRSTCARHVGNCTCDANDNAPEIRNAENVAGRGLVKTSKMLSQNDVLAVESETQQLRDAYAHGAQLTEHHLGQDDFFKRKSFAYSSTSEHLSHRSTEKENISELDSLVDERLLKANSSDILTFAIWDDPTGDTRRRCSAKNRHYSFFRGKRLDHPSTSAHDDKALLPSGTLNGARSPDTYHHRVYQHPEAAAALPVKEQENEERKPQAMSSAKHRPHTLQSRHTPQAATEVKLHDDKTSDAACFDMIECSLRDPIVRGPSGSLIHTAATLCYPHQELQAPTSEKHEHVATSFATAPRLLRPPDGGGYSVATGLPKRRLSQDYPIPAWLYKRKILPQNYRCPYQYNRTFSGPHGVINYNVTGDLSDPIILCFHGLNGNCLTFSILHAICPKYGYCVISFDLYGHGLSSSPKYVSRLRCCKHKTAMYSLDFFVQQTEDVLSHLHVLTDRSGITLLGFSMGGLIALGYAIQHPSQVARVLLVSTAGSLAPRPPLTVRLLKLLRSCVIPYSSKCVCACCCRRRRFIQQFSKGDIETGIADALWQRLIWQLFVKKGVVEAFLGCVAEVPLWSGESLFKKVGFLDIPVLILWGKDDTVAPLIHFKNFQKCFPNSHVIVFERCSHLLLAERPQAATALLLTFCEVPRDAQLQRWQYILPFTSAGEYVAKQDRHPPDFATTTEYFNTLGYEPRVVLKIPPQKKTGRNVSL